MSPKDGLAALIVVLVWGMNFVVVKLGVSEIPPLLLTTLRFAIVALALTPFLRGGQRNWKELLALSTVMGVGHFGFLFFGLSGVDAATTAIVIQLGVPFSSLLAALFFADRLGWRRGLGMVLAFTGVAILAGEPHLQSPLSLLFLLAAAFNWAVGNMIVKRLRALPSLTVNAWMALLAAPQLLLLSLLFETGQGQALAEAGWKGWGAVAYTSLCASLIAYSLWYHLVAKHEVNRVVPFTLLGPVIGVAGGILLLGEAATAHKLLGGALTIAGVAIIVLRQRKKALP